ncbi:MAG: type II toxin-antitoxin system VapC family toxin [Candidatus Geothermarchaeales archaeon]
MKTYVSDAVAFLYYLLDKLPPDPNEAFKEAETGDAVMYLPTIAAAELFYLFDAKKWFERQAEMQRRMLESINFRFYPFNRETLLESKKSRARKIHDKIIIATTKVLRAEALLTKDLEIRKLGEVKTIW